MPSQDDLDLDVGVGATQGNPFATQAVVGEEVDLPLENPFATQAVPGEEHAESMGKTQTVPNGLGTATQVVPPTLPYSHPATGKSQQPQVQAVAQVGGSSSSS